MYGAHQDPTDFAIGSVPRSRGLEELNPRGVVDSNEHDRLMAMLAAELRSSRAELAALQRLHEKAEERVARARKAKNKAERVADGLAAALALRLRVDGERRGRMRSLLSRNESPPSPQEQQQLELVRGSRFFDAEWYLKKYEDVVRAGEEPGLHFVRYGTERVRDPGPSFDTVRYLEDHPEVARDDINALVHFMLTEAGREAESYPPEV